MNLNFHCYNRRVTTITHRFTVFPFLTPQKDTIMKKILSIAAVLALVSGQAFAQVAAPAAAAPVAPAPMGSLVFGYPVATVVVAAAVVAAAAVAISDSNSTTTHH